MDEKLSKKAIERLLNQGGINTSHEKFSTEAHHLYSLVSEQQMTVKQALETVQDKKMVAELRTFLYCLKLSAVVLAMQELHGITYDQAEDLLHFLKEIGGIAE